jgi:hypothetical protein
MRSLDYQEFPTGSVATTGAGSLKIALAVCATFTVIGFWLLGAHVSAQSKFAGILFIAVFGGCGLLASLAVALPTLLGAVSRLRVDSEGISWVSGSRSLGAFGLGVKRVTLPWSNVAGLSVVDTASVPMLAAWGSRYHVDFVGVIPRDFDAAIRAFPTLWVPLTRKLFQENGVMMAGPVADHSAKQLLDIMERYRDRA